MQTIARRGYDKLDFDLCIVDECHSISKKIVEMIRTWDGEKMYYVGLSATPYAKGMGLLWQDMVVPVSQQELLKQGYLAPVRYYGGRSIDVRGLRSKALKRSSDYHPDDVARVTEEEQEGLTGDIIKNWLAHGENAQTIAFCPSIKHSKYLVQMFNEAGIPAKHIDWRVQDPFMLETSWCRLRFTTDKGAFGLLTHEVSDCLPATRRPYPTNPR